MYRILMTGMSPNLAGIETFVLNIFRNIDKNKFQIDFIKRTQDKVVFEDELVAAGAKIIYIPRKYGNLKEYNEAMSNLFENNRYDAIWDNTMRIPNIDFLLYAKKYGIKERIVHSHTSLWVGYSVKKLFHYINRHRINGVATKFFACSNVAAEFMFVGKGRKNAVIINNAIEFSKYQYSEEKRQELRKKYNLQDEYVIGHVGRIDPVKNHKFLVRLLQNLQASEKNFKLVVVGDVAKGSEPYEQEVKKFITDLDIEDKVIFAGKQMDMSAWLSLMDIYIMPSLFEGLPFSALEAQVNGLPLILSTGITKETDITGNVKFLSLNEDISLWCESVHNMVDKGRNHVGIYDKFSEKGYILEENIKLIEKMLLEE